MTATLINPSSSLGFAKRNPKFSRPYETFIYRAIEMVNTITLENAESFAEEWEYLCDRGWIFPTIEWGTTVENLKRVNNLPKSRFNVGDRVIEIDVEDGEVNCYIAGVVGAKALDANGDWLYCVIPDLKLSSPKAEPDWINEQDLKPFNRATFKRIRADLKSSYTQELSTIQAFESAL